MASVIFVSKVSSALSRVRRGVGIEAAAPQNENLPNRDGVGTGVGGSIRIVGTFKGAAVSAVESKRKRDMGEEEEEAGRGRGGSGSGTGGGGGGSGRGSSGGGGGRRRREEGGRVSIVGRQFSRGEFIRKDDIEWIEKSRRLNDHID